MHLAAWRLLEHGGHARALPVTVLFVEFVFHEARVGSAVGTAMAHYQRWSRRACGDDVVPVRGQLPHGTAIGSTGRTTGDSSGGVARRCSEGAVGAAVASRDAIVALLQC